MKKLKGVDGKLDEAWSKLVKLRAGMKCEIPNCGKTTLNSHHIFGRRSKSVRWDVMNGICLCAWHHVLNPKFSAHATPITFNKWLEDTKGSDFVDLLTIKHNQTSKLHPFEKQVLLDDLNKQIKDYENNS